MTATTTVILVETTVPVIQFRMLKKKKLKMLKKKMSA